MRSSETLLQATLNRLGARLQEGFANAKQEMTKIIQEAPNQIRDELDLLQEEIIQEADRLENEFSNSDNIYESSMYSPEKEHNIQEKIDIIRAKVTKISKILEKNPR